MCAMATTAADIRLAGLVREAAARTGYTQQALAGILGITREALSARLNGRARWTLSEVAALARALDLDLYALLDSASDGDEVLAS